jgi:hypothetical protein
MRGTATYTLTDGGQDKLDFKLVFNSSKFMIPEASGLTELLSAGALEHASSLMKPVTKSFDQVLTKLSTGVNFAIVEQVDNTAYMHSKTLKGHSVAFLIKFNSDKNLVSIEGKATDPNILASLTDEIREMNL